MCIEFQIVLAGREHKPNFLSTLERNWKTGYLRKYKHMKMTRSSFHLILNLYFNRAYWTEVNHLLVGFGQEICRPIGPKCGGCLCKELCPIGKTFVEKKKPKAKRSTEKIKSTSEN